MTREKDLKFVFRMKSKRDYLSALTAEMKLFHEVPNAVFDPRKVWKRTLFKREVFED